MKLGRLFALAAGPCAFLSVVAACSGPAKGGVDRKVGTRAQPGSFRENGVTAVFEKHCGSLDCHGSLSRNMRIYSSGGLRLDNDAGNIPGTGPTTIDEINANYYSITLLEPELMNNVVHDKGDPDGLLIVKKPLGIEKHKGGTTLRRGDDAEKCIRSWLTEDPTDPKTVIDKNACAAGANFPK